MPEVTWITSAEAAEHQIANSVSRKTCLNLLVGNIFFATFAMTFGQLEINLFAFHIQQNPRQSSRVFGFE